MGLVGFLFRIPDLDRRPLHTDEAVHAVKTGILLDQGQYIYNPYEYHGPTLYYFALIPIHLSGANSFKEIPNAVPLRIVPVIFGTALILLLLLFWDGLGLPETICAAIFTAISPAFVYYSRYYIQEILPIFFTFAAITTGWRYSRKKKFLWALLAGMCLGMMHATKETSVIAYLSLFGSGILTLLWTRWIDGRQLYLRDYAHHWHIAGAIKVAAVVALFVLTAFLSNPSATVDTVRTYGFYLDRAGVDNGSPTEIGIHIHPWYYFLQMLIYSHYGPGPWWSEAMILILAIVGIILSLKKKPQYGPNIYLIRFLSFYAILMTIFYSLIPYKTPWCLLGFYHPLVLLAGVGTIALFRMAPNRIIKIIISLLVGLGTFHLAIQAYRASYVFPADTRNPYVYAHTSTDLMNLVHRVESLDALHDHPLTLKVIAPDSDYWPLPWYLRKFDQVGYWNQTPDHPDAQVIITFPAFEETLAKRLQNSYIQEFYGLRPEVLLDVYIEQSLWDRFIETQM